MIFIENITLVFSHYGVVQALVLALWLFIRQRQKYLAFFFLGLSYLLFIFLYEISGWYKLFPHIIWTNVPVWFLIAPLLFLHTKESILKPGTKINGNDLLHFIPVLVALFYMASFYLLSASEKITAFENFYSNSSPTDYVQLCYFLQIVSYVIIGVPKIHRKINRIKEVNSNSELSHLQLASSMYTTLLGYIVATTIITLIIKFGSFGGWHYFSISFLSLSLTILIATILFFNMFFSNQEINVPGNIDEQYFLNSGKQKYTTSSLSRNDMEVILNKLDAIMAKNELYKNPELKLSDLATASQIPSHHISQTISQLKETNFFSYVNNYRVKAVIQKLKNNKQQSITLLAIAEECGFNSESSFYRIFKSFTGYTPKSYLNNK